MADPELDTFPVLLADAREGDRAAWEQFYLRFAPSVLGYLRSQRVDEPEDLLADVWLQVVRDLAGFDGSADGFRAWILRIAHNRLVDVRRADARRPDEVIVATLPELADAGDPAPPVDDQAELERLFHGVPATQRAVLYLRYVLDLPQGDIATVLGSTLAAVKMQQRRGIDAISTRLDEETDA
ncbi:MAG: polymerase, sigma-24 subunit, subfamily [Thermoleophilia bacterium]|nr:polymerase, sigma-24 subunit, subfamily [Thermoleophilia bacterium]